MNKYIILSLFASYSVCLSSQNLDPLLSVNIKDQKKWVDSVYNNMSLDEKIGQLFFVQASSKLENNSEKILQTIDKNKIGGIIFSSGHIKNQVILTNKFQEESKTPLLISMDAEWGIGMRLDSIKNLPWNMSLGAISNNNLIEEVGKEIGYQCKRIGVHLNYAPVVDINTNPKNPIIGNRSFGEDELHVAKKSFYFLSGINKNNVLATAKHFPGHGDTSKDSHKTLPTISFNKERLYNVELFPFKELIENGLPSVMVAHLDVPALEKEKFLPSSLSKKIIDTILKKELNFKGLIITDALDMKGVSSFDKINIDLKAFLAGNDILLMSMDVKQGIKSIKDAFVNGIISEKRLSESVKKILKAKYKVGLNNYKPIEINNLISDLNNENFSNLSNKLAENISTLIKNDNNVLPIDLDQKNILNIQFGNDEGKEFSCFLNKYKKVKSIRADQINNKNTLNKLIKENDLFIVSIHMKSNTPWDNIGKNLNYNQIEIFNSLNFVKNKILVSFTNPYMLSELELEDFESILIGFQNDDVFQQTVAQQLFGAKSISGKLPVTVNDKYEFGLGLQIKSKNILSYASPEAVGINSSKLNKIDSIIKYTINSKMAPGVQVLVAKDGKIIYEKSFGKFRYQGNYKVTNNTFYDLASLTKILVTTPLIMKLVDKNIIKLDTKIGDVLTRYKSSNKSQLSIKELLSAHASLKAWIPFYKSTLNENNKPDKKYYSNYKDSLNRIKVFPNLYLNITYLDSIRNRIRDSELEKVKYKYSDLAYIISQELIENYYSDNLDNIIKNEIFYKLGINLTYNPYKFMSTTNIAPTEIDKYYRYSEIQGYVHDMTAAMFGGVSGHAGLFGNSINVAKLMQMYLQDGNYGGNQIIKKGTMNLFNQCYFCEEGNRRGVGFDKPKINNNSLSRDSFGHSGWTGTYTWADPENQIIYVFLSNRSYPDGEVALRSKLVKENIRSKIQEIIYESIIVK